MMVAAPGSDSHRNAERKGFKIAYTPYEVALVRPRAMLITLVPRLTTLASLPDWSYIRV
jgi:hypothetical protein